MRDPFLITGPAVISFSGGRTSGYMLWRILQAYDGKLPEDVVICFANTGREMPATLEFVRECGVRWNVKIHWVEYRRAPVEGQKKQRIFAEEVSHNSASRAGEPFELMLAARNIVPDPFRRFCTQDLKVGAVEWWLRHEMGWKAWSNVVGLRADETARVERKRAKEAKKAERFTTLMPLADAGVDKLEVMRFWREQPFDLGLPNADGGNCDGCFMKSSDVLARMFRAEPERMHWWVEKEQASKGGKRFVHKRTYAEIERTAHAQGVLPWDDGQPCDEGCGT